VHVKYDRTYAGLFVDSAVVVVGMTVDGVVRDIGGETSPITLPTTTPSISAEEAQRVAREAMADSLPSSASTTSTAELLVFARNDVGPVLAWKVTVLLVDSRIGELVHIDARTRAVLSRQPSVIRNASVP
jgi:Zn-dependent metalloprotease